MAVAQKGAPQVLQAIRHCIGKENDLILDRADKNLASLRVQRLEASRKLASESENWARKLFNAKVAEHDRVSLFLSQFPLLVHL